MTPAEAARNIKNARLTVINSVTTEGACKVNEKYAASPSAPIAEGDK